MQKAANIISVMTLLVSQMTPLFTIDTNVADGDNWKLEACKTYWLSTGCKVTIGGVEFEIVSFIANDHIIVSGPAQPIGAFFTLDAPVFQHGSHRKVDTERKAPTNLELPLVYLPVPEVTEEGGGGETNSDIAYTADIKPLFLMEFDPDKADIDAQQVDVIDPMNEMADVFEQLINDQPENFEDLENIKRREWMDFGNQTIWGNDKIIFEQKLSGVELKLSLEVLVNGLCDDCEDAPLVVCAPVVMTFNDDPITEVPSGGFKDVIVQTDEVVPVQTGTAIVDDENNLVVEVSVGGDPVSTTMNTDPLTDTPGGQTKNFLITHADLSPVVVTEISDDANDFVGTVPNPLVPVLDFLPMKTGASDLGSFTTGDDASSDLGSGADFFNLDNNNPFGNLKVFTGKTGGYWDEVALAWKDKNGVGTTEALAIPDDIVLNWMTYTGGSRVLGMYRVVLGVENQATHCAGNPYTFVGFADWEIFNDNVGEKYIYRGVFRNPFNYPPISHDMALSTDHIWSSYKDNAGGAWKWQPTGFLVVGASTGSRSFVYRMFVLTTDLGL